MDNELDRPKPEGLPLDPERRSFLAKICFSLMGVIAALIAAPPIGFLLLPFFRRPSQRWRSVGTASQFPIGETIRVEFLDPSPVVWTGVTAKTAAWVRRVSEDKFIAFKINCTHLGCPVLWVPDATLFMCPCHGGAYYSDGRVAAGPPLVSCLVKFCSKAI